MHEQIRILCVDDEQNVLNSIKRLFFDEEYEITTASSGAEGIALLEREQVQIIISDYRMPSMNGVEFLRQVYERWPHTVRIVLSGYADVSAIVSAINEGHIYKFIPKPWNDDELKVAISNAVERYFLFKKNRELAEELQAKNRKLGELLDEESRNLKLRSEILEAHQNLLDALPVAVIGIDLDGSVVMCNKMTAEVCGTCMLGADLRKACPGAMVEFLERVRTEGKVSLRTEIHGTAGLLLGSSFSTPNRQKGILMVFVKGND